VRVAVPRRHGQWLFRTAFLSGPKPAFFGHDVFHHLVDVSLCEISNAPRAHNRNDHALANVFSRGASMEILEKKKPPTGRLRGPCETPRHVPEFVAGPKSPNRLKNRFSFVFSNGAFS
jgi:hypothetical protein